MNPLTRNPHSTCHQHTASIDAGYTTERVDGQENRLFNIYQTPPTSTDLPLNSTNNHHRWTLSEITVRKHLFICRFQRKRTPKYKPNIPNQRKTSYQTTQPINSIATDRGFQCNRTKKTKSFSSTYLNHTLRHPT